MPRLMSVALTEQAVVERRKTVTRRAGWRTLTPGTRLTLVRKAMGRYNRTTGETEPLVRLAEVDVVAVSRERLDQITDEDVAREGFRHDDLYAYWPQGISIDSPGFVATAFVAFFCAHMGGAPDQVVTRVEWRYLDG